MPSREAQRRDRLIVVEDDPVTRAMIVGYFDEHNFEVAEAGSCAECRQLLKRGRADVIFLDVQLPDGDGFEFAKEIQVLSRAGIIFVTRRTQRSTAHSGSRSRAMSVWKPINLRPAGAGALAAAAARDRRGDTFRRRDHVRQPGGRSAGVDQVGGNLWR